MINNKIDTNYACFDGLVGVRNCGVEYSYYLDDYGFSLAKGVKITDSAYNTAKNLIDTLIAHSIDDVISDITFKGFQANKILNDIELGTVDLTEEFTGTKDLTITLDKSCTLGQLYLSNLEYYVKTSGVTTVTLIQGSTTTSLYTGTPTDNSLIQITVNSFVDDFTIRIVTAGVLYNHSGLNGCGCMNPNYWTSTNTDSDSFSYGQINFQVRCNKVKHLCKFTHLLVKPIIYKTMGKLYYQLFSTDTFNNFINAEKERALTHAVYYDSNYINLVDTERNPNEKRGQFQIEIEKLNNLLPAPKCKSCMTCDTLGWRETTNIP
jgi:hypothetical protein